MFNLKDRREVTMEKTNRIETIQKRGSTTHKLLATAAAVFMLFGTAVNVLGQTAFEGNLNNVSITDAAGDNNPPTANFTRLIGARI